MTPPKMIHYLETIEWYDSSSVGDRTSSSESSNNTILSIEQTDTQLMNLVGSEYPNYNWAVHT